MFDIDREGTSICDRPNCKTASPVPIEKPDHCQISHDAQDKDINEGLMCPPPNDLQGKCEGFDAAKDTRENENHCPSPNIRESLATNSNFNISQEVNSQSCHTVEKSSDRPKKTNVNEGSNPRDICPPEYVKQETPLDNDDNGLDVTVGLNKKAVCPTPQHKPAPDVYCTSTSEECCRRCGVPAELLDLDTSRIPTPEGEVTSDFYVTTNIPFGFKYPSTFSSYGCQRAPPVHPFYRTTSMEYGWFKPTIHTVPTSFFPTCQQFTRTQGIGGKYQNTELDTHMEGSPFDEY